MVVLGIDPGYAIVGYGIVTCSACGYKALGSGAILTEADIPFEDRLKTIYESMNELMDKVKPDAISVESLYFQNNQKTAIKVAEARGVILLCAKLAGVPVYEYTPLQVTTAVTGYGKAKKPQVMEMTKRLLKLCKMPRFDDTCDALAVAICHIHANGSKARRILNSRTGTAPR